MIKTGREDFNHEGHEEREGESSFEFLGFSFEFVEFNCFFFFRHRFLLRHPTSHKATEDRGYEGQVTRINPSTLLRVNTDYFGWLGCSRFLAWFDTSISKLTPFPHRSAG